MIILFLTYIDRSGSTFLVNTLSKNPDILICPEAEILSSLFFSNPKDKFNFSFEYLLHIFDNDLKLKHWGLNVSEIEQILKSKTNIDGFINTLMLYKKRVNPSAKLLVYKAHEIIYYYHKIIECDYNQSRFLALIRDVRGIYASQTKSFHIGKHKPMSTNPFSLAKKWNYYIDKCNKYRLDNHFFIVYFENLIQSFESEINNLISKLNIEMAIDLTRKPLFEKVLAEDQRLLHPSISDSPNFDKIIQWQEALKGKEIRILELICRKRMIRNGYKLTKPNLNKIRFSLLFLTMN